METAEGTYTFYKDDRERIKGRSMMPTETLRYIEALETIAVHALEVWRLPLIREGKERKAFDNLYDALATVNFLDEDL